MVNPTSVAPERLVPVMVTTVPGRPNEGVNPVIVGPASVNVVALVTESIV